METSLAQLFLDAVERFPDRPFLRICRGASWESVSYGRAAQRVAATLEAVERAGLQRGDRLLCYLDDTETLIPVSLACACLGVVLCPLTAVLSVDALEQLAASTGATRLFTTRALAPSVARVGRTVLTELGPDRWDAAAEGATAAALELLRARAQLVSPWDGYAIFQSAGLAGESRYVLRSHWSVVGQAPHYAQGRTANDPQLRGLLVHTMAHSSAHTTCAYSLYLAAEMGLPTALDHQASVAQIRAFAPNYLITTERVIQSFLRQADADKPAAPVFGPGPMRVVLTGTPSDPEVLMRLIGEGVDAQECFGAQEMGLVSLTPPREWKRDWPCRILPDIEVKLSDANELLVRSERAMYGYIGENAEALTRQVFTPEGFYQSGFLGELSSDGWMRVTGRRQDLLRSHDGVQVHPAKIEALIGALSWVEEVRLIGDQRPHLAALIAVKRASQEGGTTAPGFLEPAQHAALHDRVRADLAAVNRALESTERVRSFALFGGPLGSGDRKALIAAHAPVVERMYAEGVRASASWVTDDIPGKK